MLRGKKMTTSSVLIYIIQIQITWVMVIMGQIEELISDMCENLIFRSLSHHQCSSWAPNFMLSFEKLLVDRGYILIQRVMSQCYELTPLLNHHLDAFQVDGVMRMAKWNSPVSSGDVVYSCWACPNQTFLVDNLVRPFFLIKNYDEYFN